MAEKLSFRLVLFYIFLSLLLVANIFQYITKIVLEESIQRPFVTQNSVYVNYFNWTNASREEIFHQRRESLRNFCNSQTRNISSEAALTGLMGSLFTFYDEERKMLYCQQAKTGSSSLIRVLELNLPKNTKCPWQANRELHHRVHTCFKFPQALLNGSLNTALDVYSSFTSFYFVRHPLVRFVSSFQGHVVKIKRVRYKVISIDTNFPRFYSRHKSYKNSNIILFRAFVQMFLNNTHNMLYYDHFRRFVSKCQVCDLDFQFIGKVETADEDLRYLYNKTGIMDSKCVHINLSSSKDIDTLDRAQAFYSFISKSELELLKHHYRDDFNAFEYDDKIFDDVVETHPDFINE